MSRIGKAPITVPAGVNVSVDGRNVSVKGPKGELKMTVAPTMKVELNEGVITVSRPDDAKENRSLHGLTRTLINNMVVGVNEGFSKTLEVNGVGYRAELKGKDLLLKIGYSHDVIMTPHIGEFARLIKHPIPDIKKDMLNYCKAFTKKYNVALVCKDARTIVTKRFKLSYLNSSGNDGMATAGSGDVLTGIIAGLLAQGLDTYEAAVMGTFAHGLAGDIAKENSSAYYIMSQDIIHALKYLQNKNAASFLVSSL